MLELKKGRIFTFELDIVVSSKCDSRFVISSATQKIAVRTNLDSKILKQNREWIEKLDLCVDPVALRMLSITLLHHALSI